MECSQGDIVKVSGMNGMFVIVSKNAYIRSTCTAHVCPIIPRVKDGPLHIVVSGVNKTNGTVICEQIKLIDLYKRGINRVDRLAYGDIMNISDAIQGVFEYD